LKKDFITHSVFPLIAALIWGTAFAAQSICSEYIETMTFNALRGLIASITLLFVYLVMNGIKKEKTKREPVNIKKLIPGSIMCGLFLTLASNMQQLGIGMTSAGKAGFITALYIVIVPLLGLFIKKKCGINIWISIVIAIAGFYFLCITEDFSITPGDFYVLICSVLFSIHILVIDHYTQSVNGVLLSLGQFIVVTILSGIGMMIFENPSLHLISKCILPTLYVGIFSSGVAYTLQIIAMRGSNPTVVSLILSLESVFSVIGGAIILGERLTTKEYIGCILVFAAAILSQLPAELISGKRLKK